VFDSDATEEWMETAANLRCLEMAERRFDAGLVQQIVEEERRK
jgi:hypothetical protein